MEKIGVWRRLPQGEGLRALPGAATEGRPYESIQPYAAEGGRATMPRATAPPNHTFGERCDGLHVFDELYHFRGA